MYAGTWYPLEPISMMRTSSEATLTVSTEKGEGKIRPRKRLGESNPRVSN